MKSLRMLIALVAVSWFTAATHAQERQPRKGIDAATVAAYENSGRVRRVGDSWHLWPGQMAAEQFLPGFSFKDGPPAKLPAVAVPFGLSIGNLRDGSLPGI